MLENTQRFSTNQQVSDITLLLWKLGSLCIDHMETLLYGTDYKHGYLFNPLNEGMYNDQREALLDLMMDLAQELGMSKEEVNAAWERVKGGRHEHGKQ